MRLSTLCAVSLLAFSLVGCSSGIGQAPISTSGQSNAVAPAFHSGSPLVAVKDIETELAAAGPRYWAVLGLGSPTNVSITGPSAILGYHNVGVAGASQFSMSDGFVSKQVVISSSATTNVSGPSVIKGGIVVDDSALSAAVTAAQSASGYFAGLSGSPGTPTDINITNPSGNMTVIATSHTTVVNLNDLILNGGSTLTFQASSPLWQFIVNVSGRFVIQGGSRIVASGVAPPRILYNIVGTGQDVAMGGGTQNGVPNSRVDGIVLATQRNIALSPGFVRPEIIGGGQQITITSGGQVADHDN